MLVEPRDGLLFRAVAGFVVDAAVLDARDGDELLDAGGWGLSVWSFLGVAGREEAAVIGGAELAAEFLLQF